MDTIICNNRWISGIKQMLIVVFLFICFSCIFFPIVFYSFIIELKNEITSHVILLGIISLFSLVIIISTFGVSMMLIFGKIYIVLNNFKIIVNQYVFRICINSKQIPLTSDTRILLESGPSNSNAYIFRNNGKVQIFQMDPVVYSIKIQRLDYTDVIFSSGNYSRILKLFDQICGRYPELKSEMDISSEKQLLVEYRKKINFVKKRIILSLSILCVFSTILTAIPLSVEYVNYKSSKNWVEIRGRVEEVQKSEKQEQLCVSYYWKEKKYIHSHMRKKLLSRYGENITKENFVPVHVNPENPKQYTLGSSRLSNMIGIIICCCLSLIFSILLFCFFLKIKSKNNDKI